MSRADSIAMDPRRVAFRDFGELGVMMARGDLFEVEGVALDLVRALRQGPATVGALAGPIARRYEVPLAQVTADVAEFAGDLRAAGLLFGGEAGAGATTGRAGATTGQGGAPPPTALRCWELARSRLIPLKCKLSLTYRCNIACKFCYNGQRPATPGGLSQRDELSLDEIAGLLDQLHAAGTFILTLTGGEPFSRADLLDIVRLAADRGFAIELLTNGTRLTPQAAAGLADLGVQLVVIPLFGVNRETHDRFVQQRGAFDRARHGLRLLREAGVEVGVRCAIMSHNFAEWRQLRALVEESGARYFPHVQVHLPVDGRSDLRGQRLGDAELSELFDAGLELNPVYRCQLGHARVDILPNGVVSPCALVSAAAGSIRERPFAEIWRDSPVLCHLRATLPDAVACGTCSSGDAAYRCGVDALYDDGGFGSESSYAARVGRVAEAATGEGR